MQAVAQIHLWRIQFKLGYLKPSGSLKITPQSIQHNHEFIGINASTHHDSMLVNFATIKAT